MTARPEKLDECISVSGLQPRSYTIVPPDACEVPYPPHNLRRLLRPVYANIIVAQRRASIGSMFNSEDDRLVELRSRGVNIDSNLNNIALGAHGMVARDVRNEPPEVHHI